jgi:hypothetical protein
MHINSYSAKYLFTYRFSVFSNISLTKDFSEQFFPVAKCNESIET